MAEHNHNYTFSMNTKSVCKFCGSPDHWALHCPDKNKDEETNRN